MHTGLGYSTDRTKGWDVKAYMASQQDKDRQLEIVLGMILEELKRFNEVQSPAAVQGEAGLLL